MQNSHRKVSFTESWVLFFRNYAEFSGRSSRSAYWYWFLWSVLISILIEAFRISSGGASLVDLIDLLWSLAVIVPGVAISARRLHDVGRSGWWLLIAFTIVGLIPLFIWYVRAGDSDLNKYGENIEQGKKSTNL